MFTYLWLACRFLQSAVRSRCDVALENLVLRLVSPEELTAASRSILGLPDEGEATAGIAEWAGFRGEPGGGEGDPDGEALGDAAVPAAGGA